MSQSTLFAELRTSDARLSPCGQYRYWLMRRWAPGPRVLYVMLNPSTADASVDDPTIRRCVGFARALGLGGLEVVNLFAWRSTSPDAMFDRARSGEDIIGPDCDAAILDAVRGAGLVVAAWGADRRAAERAEAVLTAASRVADVHCLARSGGGAPRHPLYLPAAARPELYRAKEDDRAR